MYITASTQREDVFDRE